jgi:pimeloyl-ACP methyl ester carboxylesterase
MDAEPPPDSLPEGRRHYTIASGLRFAYLEWGSADAPPLLLLHGLAVEAHVWDPLASLLSEDMLVIAPDLCGHGETGWPDPPSYTTAGFVQDTIAFAASLGLMRCDVLGHSLGALIGIALAAERPDLVHRLVIVETAPLDGAPKGPPWSALPTYESFEALLAATAETYPRTPPPLVQHLARHNARQRDDGKWTRRHAPDLQLLSLDPSWPLLESVRSPALIVRGSLSNVVPLADYERLASALQARLVTIEGAGHPIAQEKPDELAEIVRQFLLGEDGRTPA